MIDLLIAIDGTRSWGYSKRWIEEFYYSFGSDNKRINENEIKETDYKLYIPGPGILSLGPGNCLESFRRSCTWLTEKIIYHLLKQKFSDIDPVELINLNYEVVPGYSARHIVPFPIRSSNEFKFTKHTKDFYRDAITKFIEENLTLTIVGHSRGGHVALALNNKIPFRVHFLGLLDPVEWDITLPSIIKTDIIYKNYKNIFHAVRNPKFEEFSANYRGTTFTTPIVTRAWFGNDGDKGIREYNTSHGGMGGSPIDFGAIPFLNDITCNPTYIDPIQKMFLKIGTKEVEYSEKLNDLWANSYGISNNGFEQFRNATTLAKINAIGIRESMRVKEDFYSAAKNAYLHLSDQPKN